MMLVVMVMIMVMAMVMPRMSGDLVVHASVADGAVGHAGRTRA